MSALDPQQLQAVTTDAQRVLVLAGAGSGKTRVLVERVAHLMEHRHASPYEICSFTFTRKAAGELKRRLEERLGPRGRRVTARTMHSLALNMVHRFGELIGLRPDNITVYSEWESEFLLKIVAMDLGIYKGGKWKIPKRDIDEVFNHFYQRGLPPPPGHCLHELFDAFIARCRENNALSYGALLIGLRFLVPHLGDHLNFKYILVDEVQDIDPLQWQIINALVAEFGAELFVVGDIDQCQPGHVRVLTSTGEYKSLQDLDEKNDRLVTFDRHGCRVYGYESPQNHSGYFSFRKSKRFFTGNLHTVVAGGNPSPCTPNHKWPVRYVATDINKKLHCVYIMQQGDRFRIGQCLFFGQRSAGFGFAVRCRQEKADRAWILSIHETSDAASIREEVLSYRYGIPQVCFEEHAPGYKRDVIDGIYSQLNAETLKIEAKLCLAEHGRNIDFPFWGKNTWTKRGWRTSHECFACNLLENICLIPQIDGKKHRWIPVETNTWKMVQDLIVFSLDVEKHHTYVLCGGLVTCNSIYEWRGAVPDYLIQNQDAFRIFRIESNYRSAAGIVDAANRLIEHNSKRLPKTMVPAVVGPGGDEVMVRENVDSEAVVDLITDPVPLDVTVLARNHIFLEKMSSILRARGVAHVYVGQKTALTNSEGFRRFHAFLKLLVNPYDNFSFLLIRERIALGDGAYSTIRRAAADRGTSHLQAWLDGGAEGAFADFFRSDFIRDSLMAAVHQLTMMSSGASPYFADPWPRVFLEDTIQFVYAWLLENPVASWEGENPIRCYLDWLAVYDIQDEIPIERVPGITLSTIHAAKGLEWPTVLVAALNEGVLPSAHCAKDPGQLEAERRLAYVAFTRARDLLVMAIRPEESESGGRIYKNPASRFVAESLPGGSDV